MTNTNIPEIKETYQTPVLSYIGIVKDLTQAGSFQIQGGNGPDTLNGTSGQDNIQGNGGNDILNENNSEGDDLIDGGEGDDTISGGNGMNTLVGGPGRDLFIYDSDDVIKDFNKDEDRLDFRGEA